MAHSTPKKCGPFLPGTPECLQFEQLDCLEVLKVYDQCIVEDTAQVVDLPLPTCLVLPGSTVVATCTPSATTPPTCTPIAVGPFIDGTFFRPFTFQNTVTVDVTITTPAAGPTPVCTTPITLTGITPPVILWAPPGTTPQCNVLSIGDCTAIATLPALSTTPVVTAFVPVCKEVQTKALVKLVIPTLGFCEPPFCTTSPVFVCPPTEIFPPQRCAAPPTVTLLNGTVTPATPIAGITVTITRTGVATPFTAITDLTGTATFSSPNIGAILGGLDTVSFTIGGKLVTYPVPAEFTDTNGNVHDSHSVCNITFTETATTPVTFSAALDGFTDATTGPFDP